MLQWSCTFQCTVIGSEENGNCFYLAVCWIFRVYEARKNNLAPSGVVAGQSSVYNITFSKDKIKSQLQRSVTLSNCCITQAQFLLEVVRIFTWLEVRAIMKGMQFKWNYTPCKFIGNFCSPPIGLKWNLKESTAPINYFHANSQSGQWLSRQTVK